MILVGVSFSRARKPRTDVPVVPLVLVDDPRWEVVLLLFLFLLVLCVGKVARVCRCGVLFLLFVVCLFVCLFVCLLVCLFVSFFLSFFLSFFFCRYALEEMALSLSVP